MISKSKYFAFILFICILFSMAAVSAGDNQADEPEQDLILNDGTSIGELTETSKSYDDFYDDIKDCTDTFNIENNYVYSKSDNNTELIFNQRNLVINGNNHVIDGSNKGYGFAFTEPTGVNVTVNDLTFINCNGPFYAITGNITLNNVVFTNNFNSKGDGIVQIIDNANLILNNCNFTRNSNPGDSSGVVTVGSASNVTLNNCNFDSNIDTSLVHASSSDVAIYNSHFYNTRSGSCAPIFVNRMGLVIENCTFENLSSRYGGAIHFRGDRLSVKNSSFRNTHALSGGAILARYFVIPVALDENKKVIYRPSDDWSIENCEFLNATSDHNGGAIYTHSNPAEKGFAAKTIHITNCNFTDSASCAGGAIGHQDGSLNITDTNFINSKADDFGGAICTSWTNLTLTNCRVINSSAGSNAGAIYFDKGKLTIDKSDFINNKVNEIFSGKESIIYANDVEANIKNSTFDNGGCVAIYANFAANSNIEDVDSTDLFLMNNTDYIVSVENKGIRLNLTGNSIVVDELPSRFNLRDWGWVSPLKYQENSMQCWAFATVAALECSLLKSTGVLYNFSENNLYDLQLKYFRQGDSRIIDVGFSYSGLGYALSWYGVVPAESNPFDERGMFSDVIETDDRIHVQDAMIILAGRNDTVELLKWAVIKYGPAVVGYSTIPMDYNKTSYTDEELQPGHYVAVIGWDDNYPAENFNKTEIYANNPPVRNGAWLVKDSECADLIENETSLIGNGGYVWISYDNPSFLAKDLTSIIPQAAAVVYIFENTVDYHVNYQTDLTALAGFDSSYTYYSNEFTSKYSELIGAVGTYFNESGIDYSFDVYVNDVKVHSQTGVSEFAGFRTIVLSKYIPVAEGDEFKVVFKSNALPYQAYSRSHYIPGMTFVSADGSSWSDFTLENKTVCLKVYTVRDDTKIIDNNDISVVYGDESYFSVRVVTGDRHAVGAGAEVKFAINGKTTTATTDSNGIAKIRITEVPGTYVITTTLNNDTYTNTITVVSKSDDKPTPSPNPDVKPVPDRIVPAIVQGKATDHAYTLYRASDMKLICYNVINLKALMDLFKLNLTNGHLKVYVDGTLVFDGDVDDDLSRVIFEIIEKFLGKHEITIEFTGADGKTQKLNETVIIE